MTLFEFIRQARFTVSQNGYVEEFGFSTLYVRATTRKFNGEKVRTLDIANVAATLPGQGTFTKLIESIQINFPNLWIYVENVHNERLQQKLPKLGFIKTADYNEYPCYYLEPLTANTPAIRELTYRPMSGR